ncbi:hypothetical protein ACFYNZ_00670 [Streptomyces kebangsaanensis]|uniref:Uncharacterized protein n=1 Tax=Streptomyces kebangsaanensis TaxID=864058 RepID=A0ABW6KNR5_9ACTN
MTNQTDAPGRELVLADGLSPADAVLVHREALRVLRHAIDAAHLDAYSDDVWPPAVLPSYERALSLAREALAVAVADGSRSRCHDPGMGIDIDVRDDEQFQVLSDLVPYTINAEGRRGDRLVFSASDSGTSLWFTVTREQEEELLSRLTELGIPTTALAAQRR